WPAGTRSGRRSRSRRSPAGPRTTWTPTSPNTGCSPTRCSPTATPPWAARPAPAGCWRARTPAPDAGRAAPRPSAGCTADHDDPSGDQRENRSHRLAHGSAERRQDHHRPRTRRAAARGRTARGGARRRRDPRVPLRGPRLQPRGPAHQRAAHRFRRRPARPQRRHRPRPRHRALRRQPGSGTQAPRRARHPVRRGARGDPGRGVLRTGREGAVRQAGRGRTHRADRGGRPVRGARGTRPAHRVAAPDRPGVRRGGAHPAERKGTGMTTVATVTEGTEGTAGPYALSHLDALESEAVHIFREVAGEFENPVILFSGGKDSILMLHLALKAFTPAPVPFALLHVDTGHNFPEVLDYRDRTVARHGLRLHVASVQDYIDRGVLKERPDGTRNPLQTLPLTETIAAERFDAVFGGGRRDEEKARAKERVFSLRDEFSQWDPRRQRPELWNLYNGRHAPGEHVRVFPLSNWTELDVWQYIAREGIELPEIY